MNKLGSNIYTVIKDMDLLIFHRVAGTHDTKVVWDTTHDVKYMILQSMLRDESIGRVKK